MVFSKIESFLAEHIEGFFNKKFASSLQIPELQKFLERTALANKVKKENIIYLPANYIIHMPPKDYEALNKNTVKNKLRLFFLQLLAKKNYFIKDNLTIQLCKSATIKPGTCSVKITQPPQKKQLQNVEQGTIIAPVCSFKEIVEEMEIAHNPNYASLHVFKGPDIESFLPIGEQQIHIGRREQNEFILTDCNVSRVHAYISFKNGRHYLTDANSLNGIKVNGEKINSTYLRFGDEIELGNTGILYDCLES